MATINPGVTIKPLFGGQRCDLDRFDVPQDCAYLLRNWLKRDGKFVIRPGFEALGTSLADRPAGMIQYDHNSGVRMSVIGTIGKWFAYNHVTKDWSDITEGGNALTGSQDTHQVFRVSYKNNIAYLIGVNGYSDAPKKWDGVAANYSDIGGSPPKAKCMALNNNRVLLGNTYTTQPNIHQIDVGAFNDFEGGWGAVQTVNLMDTPGAITAMRELGNLVTAIYKTDSIYIASAQAGLEPFNFELKISEAVGPASNRSLINIPGGHAYMAWDGSFWFFDGVNFSSLGPHLQAHVRQTADMGEIAQSFGFFDGFRRELWFIYRGRGSATPNMGIVVCLDDMSAWPISFGSMRPTAGYGSRIMTSPVIGDLTMPLGDLDTPIYAWSHFYNHIVLVDISGQVAVDGGLTDIGEDIPMELETGMMSPSGLQAGVTAVESQHFFGRTSEDQNVAVQLGYSKTGEEPSYTTGVNINLKDAKLVLGHRKTAKSFSMKMSGSINQSVQWRGSLVNGAGRGPR